MGDDEVVDEGVVEGAPEGGAPAASAEDTVDEQLAELEDPESWDIERVVLNDTPEGRTVAAGFVRVFGSYISNEVRPLLRAIADEGGEPQLLVNGLAELLRSTADAIEFPLDHPRAGSPQG